MAYNSGYWEPLEDELRKEIADLRAELERLLSGDDWAARCIRLENLHKDLVDEHQAVERDLAEARAEIENKQYTITCAAEENQQLKEQLTEARAEIERLTKNTRFAVAINSAMQEAGQDLPDLRGHECLAKHKLLSLFDLWRKKVRPRLPGFIDDEISQRDKLIEQLVDAVKIMLSYGNDFRAIMRAQAALSAAERGEG